MGTWGSGLYGNDTTCDIRDTYMGFLKERLSNQEAYEKTLEKYEDYMKDPDEAPLFWFALAETQWKVGRLMPEVKEQALEWIDKGGGMELWEESDGSGWKETLEELKTMLNAPMPKEKRICKPIKIESFNQEGNDMLSVFGNKKITKPYFDVIGGFPPENKILRELKDYNGEEKLCVACTQLPGLATEKIFDVKGYSDSDKRRILKEWIKFLKTNTKTIKALHFNSSVPQALLEAACCQDNLEELRFKWGSYSDLSPLENLQHLKYLYLGDAVRVKDITVLEKLDNLIVLSIEGFKKIGDFSPLATLCNLEQLAIFNTPMDDLEFLRKMPNLRSLIISGVKFKKKYTREELDNLLLVLPNMHIIGDLYRTFSK